MLHSCAIGIIVNTSFLVGNWPYKASKAVNVQFPTRKPVITIIPIARECSITLTTGRCQSSSFQKGKAKPGWQIYKAVLAYHCVYESC